MSFSTPKMMPRTPNTSTPGSAPGELSGGGGGTQQRTSEAGRPLDVTDALSYLDAVKNQFQDRPQVYNHFLDIMKDFKSQQIDTPGVIQRVSKLFHGNPPLIQGFNTFLPAGYRIDISSDPTDPNTIIVTTPMGTTTQTTLNMGHIGPRSVTLQRDIPGLGPNLAQPFPYSGVQTPNTLPPLGGLGSRSLTPQQSFQIPPHVQPPYEAFSPGLQNTQATAAASFLGNLNNKNPEPTQSQEEFNHAIHYLNKIKSRYSDDTNTYKQFLDILQTYQKEQRQLHDSQVFAQVSALFKDAPDLLAEFKDFLPEAVPGFQGGVPQQSLAGSGSMPWSQGDISAPGSPPKKAAQVPKRKKRVEKEPTPVPPAKAVAPSRQTKRPKHSHKGEPGSPTFSPYPVAAQIPSEHTGLPPSSSSLSVSHAPGTLSSLANGISTNPTDKLLFFDRAKKSLENREIYEEFLKLLNLYSKEIIDVKTLLDRTGAFFDGDLLEEFKELVGWDSRRDSVENGPPGSIRTGPPEALQAQPVDDGQGPSYRRLPFSEVRLACSGRDELCRSVLNDVWVSHPTWASEDAGFLTHKKNSFEEALHKSEEERHEYHVHLEALSRTISILEPLCARIEEMSPEERAAFKLKPDFGGSGKCIYHRIIKKVYGRDSGLEVLQAMQDIPGVAVPVVLARLKQKDEEWRRAHREWSRTWREVDSKNFYKSLDHQGISFKANDKRNITAKHFVSDIEAIRKKQLKEQEKRGLSAFARGSVGYQLEYQFQDTTVLQDSLKLIYSFLDRSQGIYTSQERRSVEKFLRAFIPILFSHPVAEFSFDMTLDDDVETNGHVEANKGGRRSSGGNPQTNGVAAVDLRRKLLKTAKEKASASAASGREDKDKLNSRRGSAPGSAGGSRAVSPTFERHRSPNVPVSRQEEEQERPDDLWIRELSSQENAPPPPVEHATFFVNTTFYTLLRLLQLLYFRLSMCKEVGQQLASEKHSHLLANPVAVELGLDDPNGPATVLAQHSFEGSTGTNVVYMYLLDACEKVFAGDLDQSTFEEHMRWFFGNKAFHLFTLDKLITALVKQVQTIISDVKCQELWSLLQSAQSSEALTNKEFIRYRREAERHVGQDDHLYRVQWKLHAQARDTKTIRIHLMRAEDASVDGDVSSLGRWREYVDTYVMRHPTEWMGDLSGEKSGIFLKRTRNDTALGASIEGNLSIRISLPSYKIVYDDGTEEVIYRQLNKEWEGRVREEAEARRRRCKMLNC
uniref:Putative histone deacetylase complex, SIN3 component n=1 Tax=Moniliophthora roreri TaxID=221103 RepID=A0A0W0G4L7_MONRR